MIGLPRLLDGGEGEAAESVAQFAVELGRRTTTPIELWDERFTTTIAERSLIESGVRRKTRREVIDAVAAAVLLQSWLDARRIAAARADAMSQPSHSGSASSAPASRTRRAR